MSKPNSRDEHPLGDEWPTRRSHVSLSFRATAGDILRPSQWSSLACTLPCSHISGCTEITRQKMAEDSSRGGEGSCCSQRTKPALPPTSSFFSHAQARTFQTVGGPAGKALLAFGHTLFFCALFRVFRDEQTIGFVGLLQGFVFHFSVQGRFSSPQTLFGALQRAGLCGRLLRGRLSRTWRALLS